MNVILFGHVIIFILIKFKTWLNNVFNFINIMTLFYYLFDFYTNSNIELVIDMTNIIININQVYIRFLCLKTNKKKLYVYDNIFMFLEIA